MARIRQLSSIATGEYLATVTWRERIGDRDIDRCAELAPLKVTKSKVTIYLDDDGEETLEFSRARNKTVQAYIDMDIENMVRERTLNWLRNSTRCCYGETAIGGCDIHTEEWITSTVDAEIKRIRCEMLPPPNRQEIEREAAARREERVGSVRSGNGEWRKDRKSGGWCVHIEDHQPGDTVTVRRKNGGTSEVKLLRAVSVDLYAVAAV